MEIRPLVDKFKVRVSDFRDRQRKKKIMNRFGDKCPRCSRALIKFMFHDSCYDRFKVLARRAQREKAVGPKAFRKGCPMCGKMAVNKKLFCSFCGFYK